jgi:hypothetical protein
MFLRRCEMSALTLLKRVLLEEDKYPNYITSEDLIEDTLELVDTDIATIRRVLFQLVEKYPKIVVRDFNHWHFALYHINLPKLIAKIIKENKQPQEGMCRVLTQCNMFKNENFKNRDWLEREYVIKNRSANDIAKECGCIKETVWHYAWKFGFKKYKKEVR